MTAAIIGATGYAGVELVRLLSRHPEVEVLRLSSTSFEGQAFTDIYPEFLGCLPKDSVTLLPAAEAVAGTDVVFAALPAGTSEEFAEIAVEQGAPFIDMGADFRFGGDEKTYQAWYGKSYSKPALHRRELYGLPEMNRDEIKEFGARFRNGETVDGRKFVPVVGNPGCYPTASSLGAFPALVAGLYGGGPIIVDAASGVTGAGREPARLYHFPEMSDSMTAYKTGAHRHTPEITRNLSAALGRTVPVVFTPHLAPMNRGILATVYIPLAEKFRPASSRQAAAWLRPASTETEAVLNNIRTVYTKFYQNEPFVRVLPPGLYAATNRVRASNYCDISVHIDQSCNTIIILSAIDNMVKGAAGQAVQNMNLLFGYEETTGLLQAPTLF
jgi:N-acetyl-gamma-glutamyl-phosphate reductase